MVTEFFMPMKSPPTTTHQQKQVACVNGAPVFYEPPELKAARAKLMAHLGQHVPERKYTGAVRLMVKWCFPIKGKHQNGEWKATKPDTDNLQKLLKDCMTDCGYWKDDALVASEIVEKFWASLPGIYVKIEEL
ncbi:RusA family crossover junction endodeoxyribonuclease [Paenibacillus sp. UMB7766-LJ446]|uniref:RusA family crossover junction endodeoxyribonuclease n=1 Tax=Paenibacillus sp. UMB7766-LJ446 TaxID=3046313 RepID=UPI00254C64D4|nr:RusA family crossover junction endodeoxyribonuclease [Paenibacillus sp. UMB7766-LJ446]MDK8193756.1 RusA family crossover junction endodeoxyribonuclease [Paenibacillus sp. UMB7766-LJ446]